MIEPVSSEKPAHGPLGARSHQLANNEIDLHDARRQRRRDRDFDHARHVRCPFRQARAQGNACFFGRQPDKCELGNAGKRDGPDQPEHHFAAQGRRERHGRDRKDIQKNRSSGGCGKAAGGIENTGKQRRERHEENIGEDNAAIAYGQIEAGIAVKAFGRRPDQGGHEDHRKRRQPKDHGCKPVQRIARKGLRPVFGFVFLGKHGHEGGVERAFGKETSKHVGQAEGRDEGVQRAAGANQAEDQDLTHKPEDPARQGPETDGQKALQKADGFHARGLQSMPM